MLLDFQLNNYVHLFSAFQLSQLDLQCASLMRANLCGIDDVQSSVVERVRSQSTLLPTFRTLRIFYCVCKIADIFDGVQNRVPSGLGEVVILWRYHNTTPKSRTPATCAQR
jgi:hypothetical protein